jgi:4-amino-4-deoxy-L-arabinose transferase-like glycosyltransferase
VLARDGRVGGLAALLLMFNPLYRLHARYAMSDVPAEALALLSLALALWGWRRMLAGRTGAGAWLAALAAGVSCGFAVLAKINGVLALIVVAAWVLLALALPNAPPLRKVRVILAALMIAVVAPLTFVALNPFMTARPTRPLSPQPGPMAKFPPPAAVARMDTWQRARLIVQTRLDVSRGQQASFWHNALHALPERIQVVAVQGYGRFGPFGPRGRTDSTKRFDGAQDWGGWIWGPWVLAGACWAVVRGRGQLAAGEPPTAWAVLIEALVALAVVTAYLPMAWDRYQLPIQAGSALLAAGVATAAVDRLWTLARRRPAEI